MNEHEFYSLKEQVSVHKTQIDNQLEKIEIKISHLEEKISDIRGDIGDIKAMLKDLETLKIDVNSLSQHNQKIGYIIDEKINNFRKELDDKKYKDWRLWLGVASLVVGIIAIIINFIPHQG